MTLLQNDLNAHSLLALSPERRAQIRLIRSENVGPVTYDFLIKQYGSAIEALKQVPHMAQRGGRKKPIIIYTEQQLDTELDRLSQFGAGLLFKDMLEYPSLLKLLPDTPPVLSYKGNIELLKKPIVGIVGARNASVIGKQIALKFATELGQLGYVIASGLARGIDTAGHQGSLNYGTIAVVAGGIDVIYPPENTKLYNDICQQGLVIAESAFGVMPQASLFPRRNRLISGLSQGIIVAEAALKSGSLLTAQYALDQFREVFAVPGNPFDPRARGCNLLIQQGATLVQCVEDIQSGLEQLKTRRITPGSNQQSLFKENDVNYKYNVVEIEKIRHLVEHKLSSTPIHVDELIRECDVSYTDILMVLVEFELAGSIIREPGNKIVWNFNNHNIQ